MRTVAEFVDMINSAGIFTPNGIEDEIDMDGSKKVAEIDLDERRWYIIGTAVFQSGEGFFGVRGPVSLKSEQMSWEDAGVKCEAFEMEQVPSVTYRRK